jgi:hypothetical protein
MTASGTSVMNLRPSLTIAIATRAPTAAFNP